MQPQAKRILAWTVSISGFAAALVGAALLGIAMAKRDLPEAGNAEREDYPVGIIVRVGAETDPAFLSSGIQPLRDFYFAHPTAEKRAEVEDFPDSLRILGAGIDVRILRQDADVIEVDVLTGTAAGTTGWIHLSQFPPQS